MLTPIEIGADVVAVALAATKLLTIAQPLWAKLPRWLAVALPVLVADLPMVAGYFGAVSGNQDLVVAAVMTVALLVPGLSEAETTALETSGSNLNL
jgi:hypothetical protein